MRVIDCSKNSEHNQTVEAHGPVMTPIMGVRRCAWINLDQIVTNFLAHEYPAENLTVDLRANAYGHGLLHVAQALSDAGASSILVSTESDTEILRGAGIGSTLSLRGEARSHRLVGVELFGLTEETKDTTALRLVAEVIAVKRVPPHRGVSYGYTYRTTTETTLALVGLGFADGIVRSASNRAPVLVGGTPGHITGRIAMDQFVVDVGDAVVTTGDPVVVFGSPRYNEPTVHEWAHSVQLPPEVLTTRLGSRIERRRGA